MKVMFLPVSCDLSAAMSVLSEHPTQVSNEIESLEWSDLEGSTDNGSEDDLDEMYDDDRVEDEDWEIAEKGGLNS
jgi:hypothetical protein